MRFPMRFSKMTFRFSVISLPKNPYNSKVTILKINLLSQIRSYPIQNPFNLKTVSFHSNKRELDSEFDSLKSQRVL